MICPCTSRGVVLVEVTLHWSKAVLEVSLRASMKPELASTQLRLTCGGPSVAVRITIYV
jgi:hypothetical protein